MTKTLILGIVVVLIGLFSTALARAETITINGTGDSESLLQHLAEQYLQNQQGHKIIVPPSVGSSGGMSLLLNGHTDLARLARPLKSTEQHKDIHYRLFAHTPVVFVANHPDRCVNNLTTQEILGIYRGDITSWHQMGRCKEQKIYVANREEGDSSRSVIKKQLSGWAEIDSFAGKVIFSTPETLEVLIKYPYTLGYLPMTASINSSLQVFTLNGFAPTVNNIASGTYPLSTSLGLAWKGELKGLAKGFIEYLFSPSGQKEIIAFGAIPARAR